MAHTASVVLAQLAPGPFDAQLAIDLGWARALVLGATLVGVAFVLPSFPMVLAAGLVVFGSGLAVVPFLHGGVVQHYHWLTERQFLEAIAVSMITSGPVVITVAFIGYLVAGFPGAVLAAIGIFVPCYLTVVVAAPHFHRLSGNRLVRAFVDGVTAAATGAIAGAAFVLGRRAIVDLPTVLIAFATLALHFLQKRLPEPALILPAGITGILLTGAAPVCAQ